MTLHGFVSEQRLAALAMRCFRRNVHCNGARPGSPPSNYFAVINEHQ